MKEKRKNFDRAALITYSICLAKPALHSSAYVFKDDETNKVYRNKWNENFQVPTEFINFCKERKLSKWLLVLREKNFLDYLEANEGRITFGFEQCVEMENRQKSSDELMETEQSGYYNTIKHFFKYSREQIKNKSKSNDECESEEDDEDSEDENYAFEDSEEEEYVEGFSWEDISERLSGLHNLEKNFPFIKDIIETLYLIPFFTEFHEFTTLYKKSNFQNRKVSDQQKKSPLNKNNANNTNVPENARNVVDLFTIFNRNSRVEEVLVNDPLNNKQNEDIDRYISSQSKIDQDSSDSLSFFHQLSPNQQEKWIGIAEKWSSYKNGNLVKKDSLICWNYFGKRNCRNTDCMFLHVLRPHNIPSMKDKCEEINKLFDTNPQTKLCVDGFLGKTCKSHSNCLNSLKLNHISLNDQTYLKKWYRICWNHVFGQCNSGEDCSFAHKILIHNLEEENEEELSKINSNLDKKLCLRYFRTSVCNYTNCSDSHHITVSQLSKYDREHYLSWQNICWNYILENACNRGDQCKNLHEINKTHFQNADNLRFDNFMDSLHNKKKLCLPFFQNRSSCDVQRCCFEHFFSVSDMKKKYQMNFYKWQSLCWDYFFDRSCDIRFCKRSHNFQDFHFESSENVDIEKINDELSKQKLCIHYFQRDPCSDNCTLSHCLDIDSLSRQAFTFQNYKKSRLCWGWFFKGKCTNVCRLDHQLIIEHFNFSEQEKIIEKNKKFRSYVQEYKKGICKSALNNSDNCENCRFYHPQHLNIKIFSQTNQYHFKVEKK